MNNSLTIPPFAVTLIRVFTLVGAELKNGSAVFSLLKLVSFSFLSFF